MGRISVEHISDEKRRELNIPDAPENKNGWSVWECPVSEFDWTYSGEETAYLYKGKVKVIAGDETVEFGAGDLVVFPAGLSCRWIVEEDVTKVYMFR